MATGETDVYVAKRGALVTYEGRRITLVRGKTTVRAGHPMLVGREDLFEPLRVQYDLPGEVEAEEPQAEPEQEEAPAAPEQETPAPARRSQGTQRGKTAGQSSQ